MATRKPRTQRAAQSAPAAPQLPTAPTPASAWNQEALYMLPSGNVARLRRPGVLAIASATNGDNPITDAVLLQHMSSGGTPASDEERAANIRKNVAVFVAIAKLAFVSPRIVDEPDYAADEIAPGDVEDLDLQWLYWTFIQGGAQAAAPFRIG